MFHHHSLMLIQGNYQKFFLIIFCTEVNLYFYRPTEFADVILPLPMVPITDRSFPMSSIPLPRLPDPQAQFSSDLIPDSFINHQYLRPKPISQTVLENLRMNGPIGYALNTQKISRNLVI